MFSVFTNDLEWFGKEKYIIAKLYQEVIQSSNLQDTIDVYIDPFAINVKKKSATKASATKSLLHWIQEKQYHPLFHTVFGDALSDIAIGEELQRQGKKFTFVFVGDIAKLVQKPSFPLIITKEKYDKGTLEYLSPQI